MGQPGEANIAISEVAPNEGWVELYNRGATGADLRDWSLADGSSPTRITLGKNRSVSPHGFIVVEAQSLHLAEPGGMVVLQRPDGSAADMVPVGPVAAHQGWSRYPVHGGDWYANTPLTPGHFNLPPEVLLTASRPQAKAAAAAETAVTQAAALALNANVQPVGISKLILGLMFLLIIAAGVWTLVRRRAMP